MITTADLFIMRMWKAREECEVQASVVGMEVHVMVKADSFLEGCAEPKLRKTEGRKKIANARNLLTHRLK